MSNEIVVETKEKANPLFAKIRVLEAKVARLAEFLEVMYGHDIDGDGKIGNVASKIKLPLIALCALFAVNAFAVPFTPTADVTGTNIVDRKLNGNLGPSVGQTNVIMELKSTGDLKIAGNITESGSAQFIKAGTCTNGQTVTYSAVLTTLSSVVVTPAAAIGATDVTYVTANTTNFVLTSGAIGTNFYYVVYGVK